MHTTLTKGLALVVLSVGLVAAGCGSSDSSKGQSFTFKTSPKPTSVRFVDQAPRSPTGQPDHLSAGDQIIQTTSVLDTAGKRVGTETCVLTFLTPSVNFNSVDLSPCVYTLKGGTIYTQGLHGPGNNAPDSIVGGTGTYNGARGTLATKGGDIIFNLLPKD